MVKAWFEGAWRRRSSQRQAPGSAPLVATFFAQGFFCKQRSNYAARPSGTKLHGSFSEKISNQLEKAGCGFRLAELRRKKRLAKKRRRI
jgi:hypothetical protein